MLKVMSSQQRAEREKERERERGGGGDFNAQPTMTVISGRNTFCQNAIHGAVL